MRCRGWGGGGPRFFNKNPFPNFNTASPLVKLWSKRGLEDALLEIKAGASKIRNKINHR